MYAMTKGTGCYEKTFEKYKLFVAGWKAENIVMFLREEFGRELKGVA